MIAALTIIIFGALVLIGKNDGDPTTGFRSDSIIEPLYV